MAECKLKGVVDNSIALTGRIRLKDSVNSFAANS